MKRTLLIPALLDAHWQLLRWAFASDAWEPVVLEEREGAEHLGLRHLHGDLCYPFTLIAGQVLAALQSGRYDPARTGVLISQAGDACLGSCLIRLLRPVLDRAGFGQVALLSLNVRYLERDAALPVSFPMARRALAAALWGDALMLAARQTRPHEAAPGSTDRLIRVWTETLSADLRENRNLSSAGILRRCRELTADFRAVERVPRPVQKIAVVGDLYTKYCRLGNWDLEQFLERHGCEMAVNGITWHFLYYLDTHLTGPRRRAAKPLLRHIRGLQAGLCRILAEAGFAVLPPYRELKALAVEYSCTGSSLGSGWLLAGEAAGWVRAGYRKVLAALPFGCLPGHIYGRGQYAALQRRLPGSLIVGVDYDASLREGTVESRIRMLLDTELPPAGFR